MDASAPVEAGAPAPAFSAGFFERPVHAVARDLVGARLLFGGAGGVIVETEAYDRDDPASHSFRGPTARNAAMFGPAGHAYVYLIYGMYRCLNVVCGSPGRGAAVLIRALAPDAGLASMGERRRRPDLKQLCNGPGRLCQALGIERVHDGLDLRAAPFGLVPATTPVDLLVGPRIGITKAVELPWRFGLAGSPHLSRRFAAPPR